MNRICGWSGLGLVLLALSGCQTRMAGMTLPSPYYLIHPPQYIPQSPPFPLSRELAGQEAVAAAPLGGAPPAVPLPPALPPGGPPAVPPAGPLP